MNDKLVALAFMILGSFFLFEALRMPVENIYGAYGAPGVAPAIFSTVVILLCSVMLFRKKPMMKIEQKIDRNVARTELRRLIISVVAFLVYVYLLGKVNFILLTSIFLSFTPLLFYKKRIWLLPIIGVLTTVGIYYIFAKVFYLPIP